MFILCFFVCFFKHENLFFFNDSSYNSISKQTGKIEYSQVKLHHNILCNAIYQIEIIRNSVMLLFWS